MSDANDFLLGGGTPSAKFENVGDTVTGVIESTEVRQQTDIQTGTPLTWDNGDPRMQLVVTLRTDERDDSDDEGLRAIYVKGSKSRGSQSLHDAIRSAVESAGAKGLEAGGTLTVSFIGEEPSKTRGFNPRKLWKASYTAPDKATAAGEYLGTHAPAAPPAAASPAPAPGPAGAGAGDTAGKARQMIGLGLDDATIAGATGLDAAVVATLRTAPAEPPF